MIRQGAKREPLQQRGHKQKQVTSGQRLSETSVLAETKRHEAVGSDYSTVFHVSFRHKFHGSLVLAVRG